MSITVASSILVRMEHVLNVPLDSFWIKMGFARISKLLAVWRRTKMDMDVLTALKV